MGNSACGSCGDDAVAHPNGKGRNSEQQLQKAVDCLFQKYDSDKNGYLSKKEVIRIIDAALEEAGAGREAHDDEVQLLI